MSGPEVVATRGESELARAIVDQLGVTTSPGTSVDTGWLAYLRHVVASLVREVMDRISRLLEAVPLPRGWAEVLAWIVGLTALGLVAIVVWRALSNRRRTPADEATEVVEARAEAPGPERDAAAWRAELDALLAAGRAREALAALWWWLARTLAGSGADPAWTGRELLEESGRPDLLPGVRRLEALAYGRSHPRVADVRSLAAELEGSVA